MNKAVAEMLGVCLTEFVKGNITMTAEEYISAMSEQRSAYEACMKMYMACSEDEKPFYPDLEEELNKNYPRIFSKSYDRERQLRDILIWVYTDEYVYIAARYAEFVGYESRDFVYGVVIPKDVRGYVTDIVSRWEVTEEIFNKMVSVAI